eukprot:g2497.t1
MSSFGFAQEWSDDWWLVYAVRSGSAELVRVRVTCLHDVAVALQRVNHSQRLEFELVSDSAALDENFAWLGELLRAKELRAAAKKANDENQKQKNAAEESAKAQAPCVVLERARVVNVKDGEDPDPLACGLGRVAPLPRCETSMLIQQIHTRAADVLPARKQKKPASAKAKRPQVEAETGGRRQRVAWEMQWREVNKNGAGAPELRSCSINVSSVKFYLARLAKGSRAVWKCHINEPPGFDVDDQEQQEQVQDSAAAPAAEANAGEGPRYTSAQCASTDDRDVEEARIECVQNACSILQVAYRPASAEEKLRAIRVHQELFKSWKQNDHDGDASTCAALSDSSNSGSESVESSSDDD